MKRFISLSLFTAIALTITAQSDGIRVNQVGFYPNESKVAVVEPTVKQKSFAIKDATGKTVWKGKAVRKAVSPFDSKTVRQIVDFSKLTKPGTYTFVAGKEKQQIVIKEHALADVANAGMKSYYLQRCGMPIEAKYAGKYARPAAHMDNEVMVHPAAASPDRPAGTIISSPYGWYDAGDFGKYIVNSGFTIGILLQAYEINKDYLNSMKLNIPNHTQVPDFLDEIMYNLKWMLTMQDPYDGGIYHKLTTPNFEGFIMPIEGHQQRYVMQKSTQASLDFAATMALAARVYSSYPEYSDFCKNAVSAAERAYAWAVRNPSKYYDQIGNNEHFEPKVNTGMYGDREAADEFCWAATELYFTTKQNAYLQQAKAFAPEEISIPVWGDVNCLGILELINQEILGNELAKKFPLPTIKLALKAYADQVLAILPTSAFNTAHGNKKSDFIWGSNAEMSLGQSLLLFYTYKTTGDKKYLDAALGNADFVLGRNAVGYCFVTGFGTKPVMHPHQRISSADGIDAPLPGFLAGGPNAGKQDRQNCKSYKSDIPDECYTDDEGSYASNEIAINWNAYLVSVMSLLDAELK